MKKNVLITGKPKSGKSTLLQTLIKGVTAKTGFLTKEILGPNGRVGFEIETSNGKSTILSHIDFKTPFQVSKYFIDIKNFEKLLSEMPKFSSKDLLYIDEIGQMQLFSKKFEEFVLHYLNAPNTCVATISYVFENDFTKALEQRKDVVLVELTPERRAEQELFVSQLLKKIEKAKKYLEEPARFEETEEGFNLSSEHGTRKLTRDGSHWNCSCDFYKRYGICSHVIAVLEFAK